MHELAMIVSFLGVAAGATAITQLPRFIANRTELRRYERTTRRHTVTMRATRRAATMAAARAAR